MKLSEVSANPMGDRGMFRATRIAQGQLKAIGVESDADIYVELVHNPDGSTTSFRMGCAVKRGLLIVRGSLNELDSDLYEARGTLVLWPTVDDYRLEVISKDGGRQTAVVTICGETFDGAGWGRTENLLTFALACEGHLLRRL